jgi:hypothetical protein
MTGSEYRDAIARLNLSQVGAAQLFGVNQRTSRRWIADEAPIPTSVALLLKIMIKHRLSPDSTEKLI